MKRKTEAQKLIAKLEKKGVKRSEIAKALGRDSSLISQAAKGSKPVLNLLPALHSLVAKKPVTVPPRRKNKKGEEAKTRRTRVVGEIVNKQDRLLNADLSALDDGVTKRLLARIKKDGGVVSFVVIAEGFKKYRQLEKGKVEFVIGTDGLDFKWDKELSFEDQLIRMMMDEYDVENVDSLSSIQVNAFY